MIFHVRREMLRRRVQRGPFRHGPRLQNSVHLQPKIVVQARSIVPLHTKVMARLVLSLGWGGFRSLSETAFGCVLFERHKSLYPVCLRALQRCSMVHRGWSIRSEGVLWLRAFGKAISRLVWFPSRSVYSAPRAVRRLVSTC